MKKILLIMALALLSTNSFAQIQITAANMPSISDTFRYSSSNTFNYNYTLSGASYTWNFSNLNTTAQDIYKFQSLLSTPYATLAFTGMPVGAIGYKVADSIGQGQVAFKNIYNFYEKKTGGWSAVGTGFTMSALPFPAGGVYSDKDEIYLFPLKYNDSDSSTFQVTTPLGNQIVQLGTFKQKGYRLNKVDGWGTITTPYGSNINCLRIKSTVVEIDSLKIPSLSMNIGFPVTRVEYRWLSTTEKIPVLEVAGTELAGSFTPNTIRYRDNYRSISASPMAPRALFDIDKSSGKVSVDTFSFSNLSRPAFGTTYNWTINPAKGVRFVSSTNNTSKDPRLVFDSAGVFSVYLKADNFAGSDDTTALDCISITGNTNNSLQHTVLNDLFIYPNPATSELHLADQDLHTTVCRIFDSSGKLLLESISNNGLIDISQLNSGIYTILIIRENTIHINQFTKL